MKLAVMIAALVVAVVAGSVETATADVKATLLRVEESRSTTFIKDAFGRPKDSLTVQLLLRGPEARTAYRYGDVKLDEAVDDQGGSLIPEDDPLNPPHEFKDLQNNFFRQTESERKAHPDAWAYLNLAPAKRSARAIKRLRGSLNVATRGDVKTVEASGLLTAGKRTMDVPAAAGIEIALAVVRPTGKEIPGKEIRSIDLRIKGDPSALESLDVVDSAGQTVNRGTWTVSDHRHAARQQLDLRVPLDDSIKVVAKVAVDRRLTAVQFDFADIPLP